MRLDIAVDLPRMSSQVNKPLSVMQSVPPPRVATGPDTHLTRTTATEPRALEEVWIDWLQACSR
jgi:hypothetical protein